MLKQWESSKNEVQRLLARNRRACNCYYLWTYSLHGRCWKNPEQGIIMSCLRSRSAAQVLAKSNMKPVDLNPSDDWANMAMAGIAPETIMKSAYKGVAFWLAQKDVEMQVTMSKMLQQYRQKCEEMQAKFSEKLEQQHMAYQKAVKKIQLQQQEIESLAKDKEELQEKNAEKSRQKRKLEEMYELLRNDFERTKRSAIQPRNNFLQNTSTRNIFDTPNDMLHQPSRARQDTSAGTDISPVTPAQAKNFWEPQRERNMFEGVGDMMQQKKSGSGITGGNKRAISFGATKSSMFNAVGNPSNTLRNLVFSPVKRQAPSRLRPPEFTT